MSSRRGETIYAADLFCGAGGTSTGLMDAAGDLGLAVRLVAVNHWDVAIATHSANHPGTEHRCASVDSLNPRELVPGGKLDLLVASPECIHFSSARGGKPMNDQSRATAWCILRWVEALDVAALLIENVPDFRTWGPLYPDDYRDEALRNRPIPEKKGEYYKLFFYNLRKLGYVVGDAILCSADYGDATTRERLFIQARKVRIGERRPRLTWPLPSHSKPQRVSFQPGVEPWRAAREIIDWKLQGESIYTRKRPLAENTLRRIFAGLRKFSGLPFIVPQFSEANPKSVETPLGTITGTSRGVGLCEPFLVVLRNHADGRSLDDPAPALCANGQHLGLAEPFLFTMEHSTSDHACRTHPLDKPLPTVTSVDAWCMAEPYLVNMKGQSDAADIGAPTPTITAHAPHLYLAEPFVVGAGGPTGSGRPQPLGEPLGTVLAENHRCLVEPFILPPLGYHARGGEANPARSLGDPIQTITSRGGGQLIEATVEPFVIGQQSGAAPRSIEDPVPTIAAAGAISLIEPCLVAYRGSHHGRVDGDARAHSVEEPLRTQDTSNRYGLAQPFLVPNFGERDGQEPRTHSLEEPLPTVTGHGAGCLAQPFLVRYNGSEPDGQSVNEPLGTLDTRDRFALVSPELVESGEVRGEVVGWLDIRFRMLQPHELAAAHSFPGDYKFTGNREQQVKQIGNSVPRRLAAALCREILGGPAS